jgi:ABC-2 type transport system ATP-binding protein
VGQGVTVEVEGVTRRFGARTAVDDVSLDVQAGEVLGLLGPNGAGKTTLLRLVTGYLRPDAGRITIGGHDLARDELAAKALVGYAPESAAAYPELTVDGYLAFWCRIRGIRGAKRRSAIERSRRRAGLDGVGRQRIGTLSKGYRQRVAIAQALLHDPPVLVLDEPTSGLDPRQVVEARQLIARLGRSRTVVLSSHVLTEISGLCKRVAIVDHGRLVAFDEVAGLTGEGGSLEQAYLGLVRSR